MQEFEAQVVQLCHRHVRHVHPDQHAQNLCRYLLCGSAGSDHRCNWPASCWCIPSSMRWITRFMAFSPTGRARKWGRRRPWLVIGTPLLVLGFIAFYSPPDFLAGNSLFAYAMLFYILTGTLDSVINANYGALFPELFRTDRQPGLHQCPAPGFPTGGDDHQHRPDPDGHQSTGLQPDGDRVRHSGWCSDLVHELHLARSESARITKKNRNCGTA